MKSKHCPSDLAIFGGPATFAEPIHVGRPSVGDRKRFLARLNDILDRRWFTNNGHCVQELEQRLACFLNVNHCVLTCNGTMALQIAAKALGLEGEVIMPAFTFVATAHALQWQGLNPIFCDIEANTHCLDPRQVERLITTRTCAVLGVHVWGQPCAVVQLAEICRRRKLYLLFDAAHAFGCSHRGQMIGNFGNLEIFSFHATKFFHTFEGGAIATNDDVLAAKVRRMRNFGFAGIDRVEDIGINGKMPEVSAAMGLTQLEEIATVVGRNRESYRQYQHELADIPGLQIFRYNVTEQHNYQYVVLLVESSRTGVSRDFLVEALRAENVLARRYFFPGVHQAEPYCTLVPPDSWHLPVTNELVQNTAILPTGLSVSAVEITQICDIIRFVVGSQVCKQGGGL